MATATHNALLEWPRAVKRLVVVAFDICTAILATWLAFCLRLDTLHWPTGSQWAVYILAPTLAVPIFVRFGLYRAIFRYTGLAALVATGLAVGLYGIVLLAMLLALQWQGIEGIPRSLGILQPLVFLMLIGASRMLARIWLASMSLPTNTRAPRMLIYGAGSAGAQTAAAMGSAGPYALLGFIDDDEAKIGRSINGVRVHSPAEIEGLVWRLGVTDILLALPSISRDRRRRIVEALHAYPVHVRSLPGLADLASGKVSVQDFRELDIEDLLGREPVPPDPAILARNLRRRVVLVSGAGGSIGTELCRQIMREQPQRLVLLDHSEFALYEIHRELEGLNSQRGWQVELVAILGSVTNRARVEDVFRIHRPATVFHAAAYKHVPLVEVNAVEGVQNNVFGTFEMARAAWQCGTARFVLVSTDKAVRPTNVMGASKRVAELILQAVAAPSFAGFEDDAESRAGVGKAATCFSMVRFGNVLGSSGSVVPMFRRQIAAGGPLTVTHRDVTRFFMTIPEAGQLVLQAGAMATGGEVFLLDMGEPVKIMDLARRMIILSGLTVRDAENPEGDMEIMVTGLRAGEKLFEELLIGNHPEPTAHPRIMKAREALIPWPMLKDELDKLRAALQVNSESTIHALLERLVDGYKVQHGAHEKPDDATPAHRAHAGRPSAQPQSA